MRAGRVLVVDDDPDISEAMQLVLDGAGYEVLLAADGRQALDLLRNHADPCVILLDLMMPGMDGWQFLAQAKREALLAGIPVVVLSGGAFPREDILALGVAAFLTKPLDVQRLISAVETYCSRR